MLTTIKGKVIKGSGMGKKLEFPTLNVLYDGKISGVFVGRVFVEEAAKVSSIVSACPVGRSGAFSDSSSVNRKVFMAAVNIGGRPTFDGEKLCEAHLIEGDDTLAKFSIDFEKRITGADYVGIEIEVEILEKIRDIKKFSNFEELKDQISKDVKFVKNWYNSRKV